MKLRPSSIAWTLCLLVTISILGIYWANHIVLPNLDTPSSYTGAVGGPFKLTDHHGNVVTEKSWPGKYLLVYFGFTHCPDVCPTGLNRIAEALNALPADQLEKIQPLFITVDPSRDTVKDLANYVTLFHSKLIGLTGTESQIEQAESAYKVYAQKQGVGPDYMVNHSAFTYLLDPKGGVAGLYSHEITADEMQKQISQAVK